MKRWILLGTTTIVIALIIMIPSNPKLIDKVGQRVMGLFKEQVERISLPKQSKELVDQVWQIVDRQYIDATFNQQDWRSVRQDYMNRSYRSKAEAYSAIQEMLKLLNDPYTQFFEPEEFKFMQVDASSDLVGIGLYLRQDKTTKELIVVNPIESNPTYQAGIFPGDVLVKINRENTQEMTRSEAVRLLLGQVGTSVILTVRRNQRELEFEITREPIELKPIRYHTQNTPAGTIGYIRLSPFTPIAAQELREAINDLETQPVNGYILDLRSNPGGLLYSNIEIARMWLDKGTIVSTVNRQGSSNEEIARNRALTDKPLVVLINEGSAAASEILAAALQDNQRAILVGTPTAGENLIQSVRKLPDGSGLAMTIAKFLTPNGRDIAQSGVIPDQVVSLTSEQQIAMIRENSAATMNDPQYVKAVEMLTQMIQNPG
ncbi:S41 family peptidase [Coleofasciculus sp.]|uniref:S41 family peptidase n=1 Tax=Coleofasciculus sp. TaxID=3100458 RepID=UPI0039FB4AB2